MKHIFIAVVAVLALVWILNHTTTGAWAYLYLRSLWGSPEKGAFG